MDFVDPSGTTARLLREWLECLVGAPVPMRPAAGGGSADPTRLR